MKEKKKEKKLRDLDMKKKAVELEKKRENFKNSERELKEIFAKNKTKFQEADQKLITSKCNRQYDEEITSLQQELQKLTFAEEKFKTAIEQLKPFKDTLEDTVRDMKEFDNIHDLVNYYDALTVTKKCLTERLNEQIKRIEDLRSEIEAFTKDKLGQIAVTDNQIIHEHARNKNIAHSLNLWKNVTEITKQTVEEKLADIATVKLACNSIYSQLLKWKRPATIIQNDDYINQLAYVKEMIIHLQQVDLICTELARREKQSCRPNSTFISAKRET